MDIVFLVILIIFAAGLLGVVLGSIRLMSDLYFSEDELKPEIESNDNDRN